MTETRYKQLIRLVAIVTSVVLGFISAVFSIDGFGFIVPRYAWIGILLALVITAMELVFNERGMNHSITLVAAGLGAYLYGIVTNIIGI